ncbi:uncharacterized protein LOC116803586 [Drosophila sechellia]|uniref:uncharacterized protein LOC116803586 n=1 Tax=Drosophila sechellia TaxID=7238 RepID=UPI0013DE157A|nr:uncharacterized protein LOC116803586 [Drosophila sechellia]
MISPVRLVQLSIFLFSTHLVICKLKFTNIKCVTFDPEFAVFDYCFLKSVNRTYKYYSLKVKLLKTPVTNVKSKMFSPVRLIQLSIFLYTFHQVRTACKSNTIDACRFYKNQKSNPIAGYLYSLFKDYSNMNHSCPYDHDIIVEKVSISHLNTQVTDVLPVPHGDYLFHSNWYAYDIIRATADVYVTIS